MNLSDHMAKNPDTPFSKYIGMLSGSMGFNPSRIPLEKFVAYVEGDVKPEAINPILFSVLNEPVAQEPVAVTNYMEQYKLDELLFRTNMAELLRQSEAGERNMADEMRRKYESYLNSASRCSTFRTRIKEYQEAIANGSDQAEPLLDQVIDLEADGWWKFVNRQAATIYFVTSRIVLREYNPAAGIDCTVDMGQYIAVVDIHNKSANVYPCFSTPVQFSSGASYHPHVSSGGTLCWGNGEDRFFDAMNAGKLKEAMTMLRALLTTYEPSNPYRILQEYGKISERFKINVSSGMSQPLKDAVINAIPYCQYGHVEYVDVRSKYKQGTLVHRIFDRKDRLYIVDSVGNQGVTLQRLLDVNPDGDIVINKYGTKSSTMSFNDLESSSMDIAYNVIDDDILKLWIDTYIKRYNRNYDTKIIPALFLKYVMVTGHEYEFEPINGCTVTYINDNCFLFNNIRFDLAVNPISFELPDPYELAHVSEEAIERMKDANCSTLDQVSDHVMGDCYQTECSECSDEFDWDGDNYVNERYRRIYAHECGNCNYINN